MGNHATKLDSDGNTADTEEFKAENGKFIMDIVSQVNFETPEKVIKEFFKSIADLKNISQREKNKIVGALCLQMPDVKVSFGKFGYHFKSKNIEAPLVCGSIRTSVSNDEASILASGWLPNLLKNEDILQGNLQLNLGRIIGTEVEYKRPICVSDLASTLSFAYYQQKTKHLDLGFKVAEQGMSCGVDFQIYPNVKQALRYESVVRHQTNIGLMSMCFLANSGHKLKSSVKHTAVFDDRDSPLFPTKGNQVELTSEIAGLGGNVQYLKNDLRMQHIFSLPNSMVLETSMGCGLLNPLSCESNYMDTFRLGGPQSVRGFQTNGIDPKNYSVTSYWLGNIHLYLPFISSPQCESNGENKYYTQLFINSGNLGSNNNHFIKDFGDAINRIRVSCGVGLVVGIKSLGRVEVNYCIPLRCQRDDRVIQGLQFGMNFQFF